MENNNMQSQKMILR